MAQFARRWFQTGPAFVFDIRSVITLQVYRTELRSRRNGEAMRGWQGATATHSIAASREPDGRRSRRITCKLHAALSAKGRLFWARHKALIVNYSMLGLRVRTEVSLTPGQVVRIISETNPAQPTVCRVVWVQRSGCVDESEAGLVFC